MIIIFGINTPTDITAIDVDIFTVITSPAMNGSPVLPFIAPSDNSFLEYPIHTANVQYNRNVTAATAAANLLPHSTFNLCTLSTCSLKRFSSNSKCENETTVLILYNTSSAIPPATSYVFLLNINAFLTENTKNIRHNTISGLNVNNINVNSQLVVNAITIPLTNCATISTIAPNFSPTPSSICSS